MRFSLAVSVGVDARGEEERPPRLTIDDVRVVHRVLGPTSQASRVLYNSRVNLSPSPLYQDSGPSLRGFIRWSIRLSPHKDIECVFLGGLLLNPRG